MSTSEESRVEAMERRLAALERRVERLATFRSEADIHIPVLVAGNRRSPEWQEAIDWWARCNERIAAS